MKVAQILKTKGRAVKTVKPDETARVVAQRLKEERIGAMIVCHEGGILDGIICERDLAHGLAVHGDKLSSMSVSALMTKTVSVCTPDDSIGAVMTVMNERRTRHLLVKDGDRTVGIISIGDVLKHRLSEMQLEACVLRDVAIVRR
jgi:CBS domain-containing protein